LEAIPNDQEDFLLLSWDSCRYDAFMRAKKPVLDAFGPARRGWAMATYTLPAHVAMFQGFLPHVHAAEPFYNRFYQQLWRIGHRTVHVKPLVVFPSHTKSITRGFLDRGYFTVGSAAMDWFEDAEVLRDGFEEFQLNCEQARKQNSWLIAQVEKRATRRACFAFVNYGETHSPFRHEDMPDATGEVKEQFSRARLWNQRGLLQEEWKFNEEAFGRQVACAEFLDARTGELIEFFRKRGRPTTIVVCADHGECFGEQGLYGHAFYHEKIMEVPMLIFRINAPPHEPPEASIHAPKAEAK
jgi:arylsulfatase A-like enzyme